MWLALKIELIIIHNRIKNIFYYAEAVRSKVAKETTLRLCFL